MRRAPGHDRRPPARPATGQRGGAQLQPSLARSSGLTLLHAAATLSTLARLCGGAHRSSLAFPGLPRPGPERQGCPAALCPGSRTRTAGVTRLAPRSSPPRAGDLELWEAPAVSPARRLLAGGWIPEILRGAAGLSPLPGS